MEQSKEQYFLPPNQTLDDIPIDIQQLYIYYHDVEDVTTLHISSYYFLQLKSMTIGKSCFKHVREFVLDGLESLESVKIGRLCFIIDHEERDDGVCRITNCPRLRQLEIFSVVISSVLV